MSARAAAHGLVSCHDCNLVVRVPLLPPRSLAHCPRCDTPLHARKPNSLARTWAFLIAAYILYIPANLLPVSSIMWLGQEEPDTILSGVNALFASGDPEVALLLFVASICVPMLKLLVLTWLLLSVQLRWAWRPRERTRFYRIVEVIGRWSMLDIFVISILCGLVQLQAVATIEAGPGAVSFAAVVILTIFAAESFDPRLMWDTLEKEIPGR